MRTKRELIVIHVPANEVQQAFDFIKSISAPIQVLSATLNPRLIRVSYDLNDPKAVAAVKAIKWKQEPWKGFYERLGLR